MKKKHLSTYVVAVFTILSFYACKDEFDIANLNEPQKLNVSCYPSTADTTWIRVGRTIPVGKHSHADEGLTIGNAHIIYKVNDQQREIAQQIPGLYYACGPQKVGDIITLEVTAEGFEGVKSEAIVPNVIPIRIDGLKRVSVYSHSQARFETYDQLTATFSDPQETTDYYAVRVRAINYKGYAYGQANPIYDENGEIDYYQTRWSLGNGRGAYADYLSHQEKYPEAEWHMELQDSAYSYPIINNEDEPLLNPISEMDENFGFDSDFFREFYIFSDASINGQTYTLHLNVATNATVSHYEFLMRYQVQLYHITPELYRYVKALNDVENNELAQSGFSLLTPTPSNILNGVGIMGGYNVTETEWITKTYY
ncbi:DUF4249 domain-containing protein [Prevotella sp. FD3004]|uniref:DUF4249 domain-containing protein n=1 Tax=Prevotella sp. FD3004 TaxID=1408309 RepID=UPI000560AECC|nr:DUF4249 domain-containing protein [Prevotella sp. FD3004]